MKPYKHILMVLLIALVASALLTACRGNDPTVGTEAPTDGTTAPTEQSTETVTEEPETYYFIDNISEETDSSAPETKPDIQYEYTQDFSEPIGKDDAEWHINEMADTSGGFLTAVNNQHPYLSLKQKAKADLVTITVDMQANRPGAIPNDAGYIDRKSTRLNSSHSS